MLASVITSSVRNGSISEMLPIQVVLPTPKWPTTSTFIGVRTAEIYVHAITLRTVP